MGLPSGVLWAPCNIDVSRPNGFAKSPFQYDYSFFSWGNIDGHNPTGPASFSPWSWGSVNAQEPWYDGQVYGDTTGSTLTGDIPVNEEYDAARANLGAPWRIPTVDEFVELIDNCMFINADGTEVDTSRVDKKVTVNGIIGLYLQSRINGARLFLSCTGNGNGSNRNFRLTGGYYWTSKFLNSRSARFFAFDSGGVYTSIYNNRSYGFTIRPVMTL